MREVWKYPVSPGSFSVTMPAGAQVLTVQTQRGEPQMWALVDPSASQERRCFLAAGTGHMVTADAVEYLGTFQLEGGYLIFHLFEVKE